MTSLNHVSSNIESTLTPDESYFKSFMVETKPRTSLIYIIHHADMMAARIEFEKEWLPTFKNGVDEPKKNYTLRSNKKTSTKSKALNTIKSEGLKNLFDKLSVILVGKVDTAVCRFTIDNDDCFTLSLTSERLLYKELNPVSNFMDIKKVVVIGSGTMGSGIAAHLCNANVPVTLLDLKTCHVMIINLDLLFC